MDTAGGGNHLVDATSGLKAGRELNDIQSNNGDDKNGNWQNRSHDEILSLRATLSFDG